jgi:hypothetical protein
MVWSIVKLSLLPSFSTKNVRGKIAYGEGSMDVDLRLVELSNLPCNLCLHMQVAMGFNAFVTNWC